jgi:hypothetical protein
MTGFNVLVNVKDVSSRLWQNPMVKRDRPFAPMLFYRKELMAAAILLSGSVGGCAQSLPDQSAVVTFNRAVTQHIQEYSEFGFSEAEIYLTVLSNIPDEVVYQFGDRTCETVRRGGSQEQIADTIEARFSRDDERMTYRHIAQAAEKNLCPESSFPAEGWQRSLFFWIERLNGGQPL